VSDETTVLLVEDHLAMRQGLELLLRARGLRVLGSADSADEGFRLFRARCPDVTIVDLRLGSDSGVDLTCRILGEDPEAAVLVYTGVSDADAIRAAAGSGARGFTLKTGGAAQLVDAIHTVAAGGIHVDPTVARVLAPAASKAALLSRREREVLELLAGGLTGEEVAERLVLSPETVRTHVRNAMRKLGARTRVHAVALAARRHEILL
jgi:DNA-binding NarL/FixJ family response regulator